MEPNNPLNQSNQPANPMQEPAPTSPSPGAEPAVPAEPTLPMPEPTPMVPPAPATPAPAPTTPYEPLPSSVNPTYGEPMTDTTQPPDSPSGRHWYRPKLGVAAVAIILLILVMAASAAAYLGYYVPNKPENLWGKSLSNMGKGYDKISQTVDNYPAGKGSIVNGQFQTTGDFASDGTIAAASDGANTNFNLNFSTQGVKASLDLRAIKSSTSNPDLYVRVNGLDGLGGLLGGQYSDLGKSLNNLSGQWYFIDHSLVDQYASSTGSANNMQISKADAKEFLNSLGTPTKKYVFTDNEQNMAFVIKQQIGKEKIDGRNTYHYKIGVNKANLKAYNNALCDSMANTKIYKLLSAGTSGSDCKDTSDIDKINDSSTADVWVDTHTKLIHKVRYNDPNSKGTFFDLNQDYQGGNKIPLSLNFTAKDGKDVETGALTLTLDTSTNAVNITGNYKATGSTNITGTLTMDVKPSSTPVSVTKPTNSKNIMQLLDDLGLGGLTGSSPTTSAPNSTLQ